MDTNKYSQCKAHLCKMASMVKNPNLAKDEDETHQLLHK